MSEWCRNLLYKQRRYELGSYPYIYRSLWGNSGISIYFHRWDTRNLRVGACDTESPDRGMTWYLYHRLQRCHALMRTLDGTRWTICIFWDISAHVLWVSGFFSIPWFRKRHRMTPEMRLIFEVYEIRRTSVYPSSRIRRWEHPLISERCRRYHSPAWYHHAQSYP